MRDQSQEFGEGVTLVEKIRTSIRNFDSVQQSRVAYIPYMTILNASDSVTMPSYPWSMFKVVLPAEKSNRVVNSVFAFLVPSCEISERKPRLS